MNAISENRQTMGGGVTVRDPRRKKQNTEDYVGVGKEKAVGKIV